MITSVVENVESQVWKPKSLGEKYLSHSRFACLAACVWAEGNSVMSSSVPHITLSLSA